MKCEMCDREFRGSGWVVPTRPNYPNFTWETRHVLTDIKCFDVFTCGDEVCEFRAYHHGVPGRKA